MAALTRQTEGRAVFAGIGGPRMIAEGLRSLFPMEELSVMGIAEIATRIPHLLTRIRQTADEVARLRPAALITIDAPDFSFRVAARAKRLCPEVPRIHYVAPSVWAWRPGRAAKIARFLDHLLALLPFEPPYFEAEGLPCSFVGHPATEGPATRGDATAFRARYGIAPDDKLLVMLPGSRRGEIKRLLPIFIETLERVTGAVGKLPIVVPVPPYLAAQVGSAIAEHGLEMIVVQTDEEKFGAFAAASAALAKSGTVTLELALAGVPAIIAYRVNPLSYAIARRIATGKYAGLPNVILDCEMMPEFLQDAATPEALAPAIVSLLTDGDVRRRQLEGGAAVRKALALAERTPSDAAAAAVLRVAADAGRLV